MRTPIKKCIVTGAAGFIGSNLCDRLLALGIEVVGIDNLSRGVRDFLQDAERNPRFKLYIADLTDATQTINIFKQEQVDTVFHLASNADVRFGLMHPSRDLEQGTLVTQQVLEASRLSGVSKFVFASTGSIYGEPEIFPTPENCPFPVQTSLYAAAKLAAEGLIQAYAHGYGMQCYIFRFVSILGERYTHGHIFDFAKKLLKNPKEIEVLGDGKQKKSYLYIGDCINAILHVVCSSNERISILNLGTDEYLSVDQSLEIICNVMKRFPMKRYTGGARGWIGDSPFIFLDCTKIKKTGWRAEKSIQQSVEITLTYLLDHPWLLEREN